MNLLMPWQIVEYARKNGKMCNKHCSIRKFELFHENESVKKYNLKFNY